MALGIGSRVRLTKARGALVGYVSSLSGGALGPLYHVVPETPGDPDKPPMMVAEVDVAEELSIPEWSVGDRVSLVGLSGEVITAEPPFYTVAVEVVQTDHLTTTRTHRVHAYQLAQENPQ